MGRNSSNRKPYEPPRQENMHAVEEIIDRDNLINYTAMIDEVRKSEDEPETIDDEEGNALLAFMAGQNPHQEIYAMYSLLRVSPLRIRVASWQMNLYLLLAQ